MNFKMHARINDAILHGWTYLKFHKSSDGLWHDFMTLADISVDWVSGFVAFAVSQGDGNNEMVIPVQQHLVSRWRPVRGWGYNLKVPCDCDSTAWVLLALLNSSLLRPLFIRRCIEFLMQHQGVSGGFSTYLRAEEIANLINAPNEDAVRGWLSPHCCVTAVATTCLLAYGIRRENHVIQRALKYLQRKRNANGTWNSYWWEGYAYCTYHALRVLTICQAISNEDKRQSVAFLANEQLKDGSWCENNRQRGQVFTTAWMILTLLLHPTAEALALSERGVKWLLQRQRRDGSWTSYSILRIPPANIAMPSRLTGWRIDEMGTKVIIADQNRLFTSAAALWALLQFKSMVCR